MRTLTLNLSSFLAGHDANELSKLDPFLNRYIKSSSLKVSPQQSQVLGGVHSSFGPFYSRKALALELFAPVFLERDFPLVYFAENHYLNTLILPRDNLKASELKKLNFLSSKNLSIRVDEQKILEDCSLLFPRFSYEELHLFMTLYYSFEFNKFIRLSRKQVLLDIHKEIVNEVNRLSTLFTDKTELSLLNELLENNTLYSSYNTEITTKRSYQEIIDSFTHSIRRLRLC